MRNLCLACAVTLNLAFAADPVAPLDTARDVPDSVARTADPTSVAPAADTAAAAPAAEALDTGMVEAQPPAADSQPAEPDSASAQARGALDADPAVASAGKGPRPLFKDPSLAARQYVFGILGQTVAGALGFFIGSAIETAIVGEDDARQGTLSFRGIRYDNFSGAFWGASMGSLMGSSLTVYFTGQSEEQDGGLFWTLVGTGLAGAGALYIADVMDVSEEVDWKPYLPLLAIPTAGGVLGFNLSRWFSDRKRESIMGPDAGLHIHPPRLAWTRTPSGERFQLQALNLTF